MVRNDKTERGIHFSKTFTETLVNPMDHLIKLENESIFI